MSDLWLLTYEVAPLPENPAAQTSGGAYANCWIKADSQADAAEIAIHELSAALWSIVKLTEAKPVNPEVEQYPPASTRMIEQARLDGAVLAFNHWPARNRRWFKFSLRTLFVVVTVLAVWLGWNVNIVQQRRAARTRSKPHSIGVVEWAHATTAQDREYIDPRIAAIAKSKGCRKRADPTAGPHIAAIRRWLGDEPIGLVAVWNESDFPSVSALFPEAMTLLFTESSDSQNPIPMSFGGPASR